MAHVAHKQFAGELRGSSAKRTHAARPSAAADLDSAGDAMEDAVESLRQAREEQRRLQRDVERMREQFSQPERVDRSGAVRSAPHATRLRHQVVELSELLERGERAATETTLRVRRHVAALRSELDAAAEEVGALVECVATAEHSCAAATREVAGLRDTLRLLRTERDDCATRMGCLLADTKKSLDALRADVSQKDAELQRLREQNSFLRLQTVHAK